MASTRLRRTFAYPTDEDSPQASDLDEQEQEELITHLAASDASNTQLYTYVLLLLPLLPLFLYLPQLFSTATFIPAICAVSSLLATGYVLMYMPLPPASSEERKVGGRDSGVKAWAEFLGLAPEEDAGPIRTYIIPLNLALCVILALQEATARRGWREGMMVGGGYVPGFVFAVVLVARRELRKVDLGELERLKYDYKGA